MFQNLDKSLLLSLIKTGLIIIFPFISYLANNYDLLLLSSFIFFTLIASLALSVLLLLVYIFLYKLTRFKDAKAFLFLFDVAYLLCFLFLPILDFAKVIVSFFDLTRGAMAVYGLVCMMVLYFAFRVSKNKIAHTFLFLFAISVISFNLTKIIWHEVRSSISEFRPDQNTKLTLEQEPIKDKRNIYYVILDAYSSPKILKKHFSWYPHDFLKQLSGFGFYHAKNSFSSYNTTYLTLASIFALDYPVDENSPKYSDRSHFYPALLSKAQAPPLVREMKTLGYEFYIFNNYWADCKGPHAQCVKEAGFTLPYYIFNFLSATSYRTLYEGLFSLSAPSDLGAASRGNTIDKALIYLDLNGIPKKPFFMFIHHLFPHKPYIFKPNCDWKNLSEKSPETSPSIKDKKGYIDNAQCANKKALEFVQFIEKNDPKAVVVLQGDHGSHMLGAGHAPLASWSAESIAQRNLVLNLLRVPPRCRPWLYPEMNNVNSVRLALACALGQRPKLIKNKSYIGGDEGHPDFGTVRRVRIVQ